MSDDSAHASLTRQVSLELADAHIAGWKAVVLAELDRMRGVMPYADTLRISLICERRDHGPGGSDPG